MSAGYVDGIELTKDGVQRWPSGCESDEALSRVMTKDFLNTDSW
jgi:hypothetical protein